MERYRTIMRMADAPGRHDSKDLKKLGETIKGLGGRKKIKAMPLEEKLMAVRKIVSSAKNDGYSSIMVWPLEQLEKGKSHDKQLVEELDEAITITEIDAEMIPGMKRDLWGAVVINTFGKFAKVYATIELAIFAVDSIRKDEPLLFLVGAGIAACAFTIGHISKKIGDGFAEHREQMNIEKNERMKSEGVRF